MTMVTYLIFNCLLFIHFLNYLDDFCQVVHIFGFDINPNLDTIDG